MGTTHRAYSLKDKNISVFEVAEILWKIQDSLCVSQNKSFYHQFSLTDPTRVNEIQAKFDVQFTRLLSDFTLHQYDQLYKIINSPDLFKWLSLNNFIEGVNMRDYLHYWIKINTGTHPISIVLPVTDDFARIKSELKDIIKFLSIKNLFLITDKELDGMVNLLIDANLNSSNGTTYEVNGLEFFARGDCLPKGSTYMRPSSIQIKFDNAYAEKHGGEHQTLIAFYDAFNEYFKYSVTGTVVSDFNSDTFTALNDLDLFKFKLLAHIDLNKNPHFTPYDLLFTSIPSSITVENFIWKDTDPDFKDNRIRLSIEDNWDFEIEISKQIDEDYYFNIELLIGRELENQ